MPAITITNRELGPVVTALDRLKKLLRPGKLSMTVAQLLIKLRPFLKELEEQQRALLLECVTYSGEGDNRKPNIKEHYAEDGKTVDGVDFELEEGTDFWARERQMMDESTTTVDVNLLSLKDFDHMKDELVPLTGMTEMPDYEKLLLVTEGTATTATAASPRKKSKRS